MQILGAIGLLIYGMRIMSDALQKMSGSHLRHILGKMTTNRFTGMLTGAFITCAVQSSSATTVMTVSFVSAGLLTLAQAISVIMGANIGTTLTAWIMTLGYSLDLTMVVFPAFFIGMILIYRKQYHNMGDFLYGIAFMFLSLVLLSDGGKKLDLAHNPEVVDFFASFDTGSHLTIIAFLLIGTLITCIVQSSAAVMAITILLCSTGVLPIYLGIALVMGENIGTTATANLAALGAGTRARQAALAHLLFNVFGVIWILIVFFPFVDGVCNLVGYDPKSDPQPERLPVVLSMFHTCFNVANTAVLIGFIPQLQRIVQRILPERPEAGKRRVLHYIQASLIQTPEIAVLEAQKETTNFAEYTLAMFGKVKQLLVETDEKKFSSLFEEIREDEDVTDQMELEIAHFLEQVSEDHLSPETKMKIRLLMRQISELESVGDSCFSLARTINRQKDGQHLPPAAIQKLKPMVQLCELALQQMCTVMAGYRENFDMRETYRIENDINNMRDTLKRENLQTITEWAAENHPGATHQDKSSMVEDLHYNYALGTMFADIVGELEKLGDYVVNVVQARFGK